MRRWLMYLLLVLVAASFAAVAVQLSAPKIVMKWNKPWPGKGGEIVVPLSSTSLIFSSRTYDHVRAYDLNGEQLWEFKPPHPPGMIASVSVDRDMCFISTNSNWLYGLSIDGKLEWQRQLEPATDRWGYRVTVKDSILRAGLKSGDVFSFDLKGTPVDLDSPPERFTFPSRSYGVTSQHLSTPGTRYVVDGNELLWIAQDAPPKRVLSYVERLIDLFLKRPKKPANSMLEVRDTKGRVLATSQLPFSYTSNAVAMPDGSVVFVGGLGRMACYSLKP